MVKVIVYMVFIEKLIPLLNNFELGKCIKMKSTGFCGGSGTLQCTL